MSTPHNAAEPGDFAKTVLMPGDPLRAKFVAENFLDNPKLVTSVRNCLGYTGTYKGVLVSVMASGMGMPSIGIYSWELFKFYGVENIIRIGSAGSYTERLNVLDVCLADSAFSDSSFARIQGGCRKHIRFKLHRGQFCHRRRCRPRNRRGCNCSCLCSHRQKEERRGDMIYA